MSEKRVDVVFPIGTVTILACVISIAFSALMLHPSLPEEVQDFSRFFLMLLMAGMFLTLILGKPEKVFPENLPLEKGVLGLIAGFAFSSGIFILIRMLGGKGLNTLASSVEDTLSVVIIFALVALAEEIFFRSALPRMLFIALPGDENTSWLASIIISSLAFSGFHIFAYGDQASPLIFAFVSGLLFAVAYRIAAVYSGSEMSFLGVVLGHFIWDLQFTGRDIVFWSVGVFLIFILVWIALNPKTLKVR